MYDGMMGLRTLILLSAGLTAGWLGARNELRIARGADKSPRAGLLLKVRAVQYAVAFYLILATLALCSGGLYAARFSQSLALGKNAMALVFPGSLQSLTTGAIAACFWAVHFIHSFSNKHGMDIW